MLNHNRKIVSGDDKVRNVIDLSGKATRRKAKITRPQAFSSMFFVKDNDLHKAVSESFTLYLGGDEVMLQRLGKYLNPKNIPDKAPPKRLAFQQAYMKECVDLATPEVLQTVDDHIVKRWEKDNEVVDAPWLGVVANPGGAEVEAVDPVVQQNDYYQTYVLRPPSLLFLFMSFLFS